MKTFKGNHNIEAAFANFIEVVEQETGVKVTDVDCYAHRPERQTVSSALDIENIQYSANCKALKTGDFQVWGLANLDLTVFLKDDQEDLLEPYKYKLGIAEEEEEEAFSQCNLCEEDFPHDERDTRFDDPTCKSCGEQQMEEWEQEDQEMQSNYYKDVL